MTNQSLPLPLAKAYRAKDLPGYWVRTLEVPAGRKGIVLQTSGQHRMLPPGRHVVLVILTRLLGSGSGLSAGYIPEQPFAAFIKATNLLSGDDELVDASMLCLVTVADPVVFFRSQVLPLKEISAEGLKLSPHLIAENLIPLVRRYAASDLSAGLPTDYLLDQVSELVEHQLSEQGLKLNAIKMLSFIRADDRLEIASKLQKLEEKLAGIQMDAQLASLENQAQLDDFIRQMHSDIGIPAGLRPIYEASNGNMNKSSIPQKIKEKLIGTLNTWLQQHPLEQSTDQAWRILGMLKKENPQQKEKNAAASQRALSAWLRKRALLVSGMILGGCVLSVLIFALTVKATDGVRWGLLFILWGPILAVIAQNIVKVFRKQTELQDTYWDTAGIVKIDDLARGKKDRVDQLVREQIDQELSHISEMMIACRSKAYRSGDEPLAIRFMELTRRLESHRAQIQNPEFGAAPYLKDFKINPEALGQMLDYDEGLLVQIANHAEYAHILQQKVISGGMVDADLTTLESRLETFEHAFARRARAMQSK